MVMKKLIAISVVFALVAGTAFAEINVGGAVFGKVNAVEGTSEKKFIPDSDGKGGSLESQNVRASGSLTRVRLEGSGQSDDGTFGGYIRLEEGSFDGNAWWQPIDLIKFQIGGNGGDGFFAADGFMRWGWYRDMGDVLNIHDWSYGNHWGGNRSGGAFYGGFAGVTAGGAILTITPLEALAINIGIPFFEGGRAESVFKQTNAQVAYTIGGIGDLAITYVGYYAGDNETGGYLDSRKDKAKHVAVVPTTLDGSTTPTLLADSDIYSKTGTTDGANRNEKLFLYFNLTAVENLGLNFGVGFTLPAKDEPDAVEVPNIAKTTQTFTYMPPVAIGLGVSYDAGAFGAKVRVQAELAESYKYDLNADNLVTPANSFSGSYEIKGPFVLSADILPSFAINDSMKVFLSAGLKLTAARDYDIVKVVDGKNVKVTETEDAVVGWHVMPYFTKSVGWCQSFYAGFRLESDGSKYISDYGKKDGFLNSDDPIKKAIVNWSVPIGVAFQF